MNNPVQSNIISQINTESLVDTDKKVPVPVTGKQVIFIFLTAVAVITICSKSSPLYPFNDWVDANCFLTVGRSMLYGFVPYRDLYEQKGPLLYIIHAFASLISEDSFLGVYFVEITAGFFFLLISYLSMKLLYSNISIISVPILATMVYSATSFCHGDSAEELCLPLLAYTLYLGLKMIHKQIPLTRTEWFFIGITSACVLWIKFSILGFYIGWILIIGFFFFKNREYEKLFCSILCISIGVIALSIPVLLYFGINGALDNLFTAYFYNNIFVYTSNENFISRIIAILETGLIHFIRYNFFTMISVVFGFSVFLQKKDRTDFRYFLLTFISTFIFIYIGGRHYMYYSLILSIFAPIGIATVFQIFQKKVWTKLFTDTSVCKKQICTVTACLVCCILSFIFCDNTYLLQYGKEDMPQYQFAEDIKDTETATLLNYGFLDGGFYTVTGITPSTKYFCMLNIPLNDILDTQNEIIRNGDVEYIVTMDVEFDTDIYMCIDTCNMYYEGDVHTYYLYRLIK